MEKSNSKMGKTILPSAFFLIDASSYLYRAYFAISRSFSTSNGLPTKAIYGITSMIWKVLREKDPEFIAVIWDTKGPNFRHGLYKDYKANRPAMPEDLALQVPYVRSIIEALGLKQIEITGYEADDIIATLARGVQDRPVLIVSCDKDLVQLINGNVTIWNPMKDEFINLDKARERFGIEPSKLVDVMALSGDTADNIPGVPGIGPKTALKLIQTYGSLDGLMSHLDDLPNGRLRENLLASRDSIPLWLKLVSLADIAGVPMEMEVYRRMPPDQKRLRELFEQLEFTSFLKDPVPDGKRLQVHMQAPHISRRLSFGAYELVQSEDALYKWMDAVKKAGHVVIDTETTDESPMLARLVGISICIDSSAAAYIPVGHETGEPQLDLKTLIVALGPVLADPGIKKIGQNIKYDLIVLENHGFKFLGIEGDTMLASYLIDPSRHRHNLGDISIELLGHRMSSFKEVTAFQKRVKNFAFVPLDKARDYSCEDAHVTALVSEILWKKLKEADLWELFTELEVPLIRVLAGMERAGILVDEDGLETLSSEFEQRIGAIEQEIYALAGGVFNINSTKQLSEILFERMNLPQMKKTRKKTGYSTDAEVLTELANHHELPQKILDYRNLVKLKSTYVDGLKKVINPKTGRVHTSFNQTVTATGRLSSSDPNLQNIPVRTEEGRRIRAVFIAKPGHLLLSADYSQIDLRVLAHYCGDETLIHAFKRDEDIHIRTAAEVYDIMPEFVTPEMRRVAKTVNFGIVYGMRAYGLARSLGIERKQAQEFINRYFRRYPGVKRYMEDIVKEARARGYVTTLLGRRRYIPDINTSNRAVREAAERIAINTPIQGTAADIIKLAMLKIHERLDAYGGRSRILLQVHDELVLEVPEDDIAKVSRLVKEIMENVIDLHVPLKANIGIGRNWAEV
ncbi:MAG: DNA polymerase I [Dissulfurimicrobium sp.]|uniref:DNA polymerase I n=1 Tax=Dissulfurimicrobium sp. TaxID=2022436 RepID=UPI00404A35A3